MVEVRPKYTRINPTALHPHKVHRRLVRDTRHREWLRFKVEGEGKKPKFRFMTKPRGWPSTKFRYQRTITPMPKTKGARRLRKLNGGKAHPSKSNAKSAAQKAWATIRARRAKK